MQPMKTVSGQRSAVSTWMMVLILEVIAVVLAWFHFLGGVHTDEAKYLLNIPYPHPPLVRWILSQTEWIPFQEMFWRIVFASLMVQAVWLIRNPKLKAQNPKQVSNFNFKIINFESVFGFELCASNLLPAVAWLLSSAVLLQSGSIMMAPLTALQMMVFLWLLAKLGAVEQHRGWIALLWLVSLFTAYQALLFAPLVAAIFLRMRIPVWQRLVYLCAPVLLLIAYTFANPLALSSIFVHGAKDLHETILERVLRTGKVWGLGGSFAVSLLGTIGIFFSRRWELISSFLLVLAYVALARFDYYAILFTPLFVAGLGQLIAIYNLQFTKNYQLFPQGPSAILNSQFSILALFPIATAVIMWLFPLSLHPGPARDVMRVIAERGKRGDILITGPYGHEWQYESRFTVRRYIADFLTGAQAVVCVTPCSDIPGKNWQKTTVDEVDVWIKE